MVLAHEIGHVVMRQNRIQGTSPAQLLQAEIEADEFAGTACAKLGAPLESVVQAMINVPKAAQPPEGWPSPEQRIEALTRGWRKGRGISPT
jgi:hypothetical protein